VEVLQYYSKSDIPADDPLLEGLDVNFEITEPLEEAMGSTRCGGSGFILRRNALENMGSFPPESIGDKTATISSEGLGMQDLMGGYPGLARLA